MHEKILKNGRSEDGQAGKSLQKAWKDFQNGMKGSQLAKEKAAGEFLLKFTQFSLEEGVHAEMALKKASSKFEKQYKKSEKKT
jgi:hypothetical protein